MVCCPNALPHSRKPPWSSVPASPVRQPASAPRNAAPTSFVDDCEFVADERGKFSGAQSLENSENAERISLRESLIRFPCPRRPAPARKWRRNGLKRLNPRPRMVWSRKPRSHNIWYTGARLTVRSGEIVSEPRLRPAATVHEFEAQEGRWEIFRLATPWNRSKPENESRRRLRLSGHGLRIRRARRPREKTLQKKAPNVLKSHDAELKSAEAVRGLATRFGRRRIPIR